MTSTRIPLQLNTAVKRSFATVQNALVNGRVGFIVGAGADILIALDFTKNSSDLPPNWTELICALAPFPNLISNRTIERGVLKTAENWPAETASLARWWTGEREFQTEIHNQLDRPIILRRIQGGIPPHTSTYNLCRLLTQSNLIVTPNYSSYLVQALRSFNTNTKIAVLDREDLPSLPFPEPQVNPETVFVVHLHGRCSSRSSPILDAWGYNILQHDDQHYIDFLRTLFTQRSVITLGISWSDPPLRSAAAFVQRTRPYLSKRHLVFYFLSQKEKKMFGDEVRKPNPRGLGRLWSNAMREAYGVDVLFVDSRSQQHAMNQLGNKELAQLRSEDTITAFKQKLYDAGNDGVKQLVIWGEIADFLDFCGDYESPLQHRFLRAMSGVPRPTSDAIAEATEDLAQRLIAFIKIIGTNVPIRKDADVKRWCVAARIERHLRHHLYLYRPLSPIRKELWQRLWGTFPSDEWREFPADLRFNFLIGKFELKLRGVRLGKYTHDLGPLQHRFEKASRVWSNPPGPLPNKFLKDISRQQTKARAIQKLALELLDLGWESIAAKVFCDQMHFLATVASKNAETPEAPLAQWTIEQAIQASRISRAAGCFRRQVKADTIAAMWAADPVEPRVQLLGKIRAAEETQSVEPGLLGGLGAALLVCDLRARIRSGLRITDLKFLALDLFDEAGLDKTYIDDALRYWIPFAPQQVKPLLMKLAKELNVRFVQP